MIEVQMPRLSEAMTEGKLLMWNVAVGDRVEAGDQLAEVEADKANMEIESPVSGTILNLHGAPGQTIAVGTVLAEIRQEEPAIAGQSDKNPTSSQQNEHGEPVSESPLERRQKQFTENRNG